MSPNASLMGTAIAFMAFLLVKHAIVVGASSALDARQGGNPNGPLPGWNFVGCYSDTSSLRTPADPDPNATRTLKAQNLVNSTGMTPAMCTEFCSNFAFPYGFAGVKLGQECWCDGVIQLSASLKDPSDCNTPCSGDNTLTCGGLGTTRISIYADGTPSPKIPTIASRPEPGVDGAFIPYWKYLGCYSDKTTNRTLAKLLSNVTGLSAHTCAGACEDAFPGSSQIDGITEQTLLFSGVESGTQCWCGPALSSAAQKLPDIACESMGCLGLNDQACGGDLIMAVYQFSRLEQQPCEDTTFFEPFQLSAVFLDEPTSSVPITMTSILTHNNPAWGEPPSTDAGILSYCPSCPTPVTFEMDLSSQWELRVFAIPNTAINNLTVIHPGGTVNFVEVIDDDRVFIGYCTNHSPIHTNLAQLTAYAAHETTPRSTYGFEIPNPFISFALCSNLTAGGRLDIVYKPLIPQPGYNLTGCRDVILEMDFNVTVPAGTGFF